MTEQVVSKPNTFFWLACYIGKVWFGLGGDDKESTVGSQLSEPIFNSAQIIINICADASANSHWQLCIFTIPGMSWTQHCGNASSFGFEFRGPAAPMKNLSDNTCTNATASRKVYEVRHNKEWHYNRYFYRILPSSLTQLITFIRNFTI